MEHFLELISGHQYLYLFLGLFFAGETFLLPAIFLSYTNVLSIYMVGALMISATVISDIIWYFFGFYFFGQNKHSFLGERVSKGVEFLSATFKDRSLKMLFLSKFIYGTRVAAEVVCGLNKIPFWKYFAVNLAGIVTLLFGYIILIYSFASIFSRITDNLRQFQLYLGGVIILILIVEWWISKIIKNKWSQR